LPAAEIPKPLTMSDFVLQAIESQWVIFENRSFERFSISTTGR
jgi:hypothetical protein